MSVLGHARAGATGWNRPRASDIAISSADTGLALWLAAASFSYVLWRRWEEPLG